jgi:two-component system CheB/CheR fusion protein
MAREGLPHELSAIIRQAGTQDEEIVRQGLKVRTNGGYSQVDITACRLQEPEPIRGLTLITFRNEPLSPFSPTQTNARSNRQRTVTKTSNGNCST